MQTNTAQSSASRPSVLQEHRHSRSELFELEEIDRTSLVDSVREEDRYEADGVYGMGGMREPCPSCQAEHLKLVLRQKHVRRAHLYCAECGKCYDARYPDGSSALELDF